MNHPRPDTAPTPSPSLENSSTTTVRTVLRLAARVTSAKAAVQDVAAALGWTQRRVQAVRYGELHAERADVSRLVRLVAAIEARAEATAEETRRLNRIIRKNPMHDGTSAAVADRLLEKLDRRVAGVAAWDGVERRRGERRAGA